MYISKSKVGIIIVISQLMLSAIFYAFARDEARIPTSGSIVYSFARPLHVEGKYIKDDYGDIVYLRGITKGNHIAIPGGWWHPEGGTYKDGYMQWIPEAVAYNLDQMKALGFSTVRLFLPEIKRWLDNEDELTHVDGSRPRDRIRTIINFANQRGMYVILEGWTIVVTGTGDQTAIPWDPYTKPAERGTFTSPEDFIDFIAGDVDSLSAEYGNFPNVIYGFWNEPNGWDPEVDIPELYRATCQEALDRLRAKGDDHLVIYQFGYTGRESNYAIGQEQMLNGTNVVYSGHCYRHIGPNPTPYFNLKYTYEDVKDVLYNFLNIGNVINASVPFGMFEYGANIYEGHVDSVDNELAWYQNVMTILNEWNMSYTAFLWWDTNARIYGILNDSTLYPWCPPPNAAGDILRESIAAGSPG